VVEEFGLTARCALRAAARGRAAARRWLRRIWLLMTASHKLPHASPSAFACFARRTPPPRRLFPPSQRRRWSEEDRRVVFKVIMERWAASRARGGPLAGALFWSAVVDDHGAGVASGRSKRSTA